jgi:hypothetical protein
MRDRDTYYFPVVKGLFFLFILTAAGFLPPPLQGETEVNKGKTLIRRFALLAGANDGGVGRTKLRYAVSDAQAVLNVLQEMGGVSPQDSRLLQDPTRDIFVKEIKRLGRLVTQARSSSPKVEIIIYYSGHSDEKNILLGDEKFSYQDFKKEFDRIPADVRIAILDSCASGAFTRLKGGKKSPPFLIDAAYDMKGCAIMTSSSSDEASQESDRLKGAFFTHYLVSGLRGAADMTQDGRITLNEAYQFAFNETRAQTANTMDGPQHPNCNMRMSGTGDVVMTDIRESSALVKFTAGVSGRLFIHNFNNDLVAELGKTKDRTIELGLEQGKYRVVNIAANKVQEYLLDLKPGSVTEVDARKWTPLETGRLDTVVRGDLAALAKPPPLDKPKRLAVAAIGGIATQNKTGNEYVWGTGLNLIVNYPLTWRLSLEISAGYYHLSKAKLVLHQLIYSTESFNLSVDLRYLLDGTGKMRPFINGGIGIFDFGLEKNSTRYGFNLGAGIEYNIDRHTAFDTRLNLNNSWDMKLHLVSILAGWKYRF